VNNRRYSAPAALITVWGYYNPGLLPGVINIWRLTAPALFIFIAAVVSCMNVYFAPCQIKNFCKDMSNVNENSELIPKTREGIRHEDRQRGLFAETHAIMNTVSSTSSTLKELSI